MADEASIAESDLSDIARRIALDIHNASTVPAAVQQAVHADEDGQDAEECEHMLYEEPASVTHTDVETPELVSAWPSSSWNADLTPLALRRCLNICLAT